MEYKRLTKKGGLNFADKDLSLADEWGYSHIYNRLIGVREQDKPYFINVVEERNMYNLEILVKILPYVGTIWFATREEAEKRLKGLEEGGQ